MENSGDNQRCQYFNNLKLTITRVTEENDVEVAVLAETLSKVIEEEAKAHDAHFDAGGFGRVINAIVNNRIQGYILVFKDSDSYPKIAGGAIQYPSVFTKFDPAEGCFIHTPAFYSEDMYVDPIISSLFREQTKTNEHPRGKGLGTTFILNQIQNSTMGSEEVKPYGETSSCRIAEHADPNKPITCIYERLRSTQETIPNGYVLEFQQEPSFADTKRVTIKTEEIGSRKPDGSTIYYPNIFLTSWVGSSHEHKIVASYTHGISTFTGKPVIRVQITTNKKGADPETIHNVLSEMFSAAKKEIVERGWINKDDIPQSNFYELFRIHALREPDVTDVLQNMMKAQTRFLGPRPMRPVATEHGNIPTELFDTPLPEAKPFLTRPTRTSYSRQKTQTLQGKKAGSHEKFSGRTTISLRSSEPQETFHL